MKINLDKNNYKKTIKVYCSKIKGEIEIIYVDVDTDEMLQKTSLKDLNLGEYNVDVSPVEGYEIVSIEKEEDKKEEVVEEVFIKEEIIEEIEDSGEFNIDKFAKGLGISIEVGDENE